MAQCLLVSSVVIVPVMLPVAIAIVVKFALALTFLVEDGQGAAWRGAASIGARNEARRAPRRDFRA
jgi:hypothetical protein